MKHILSAINFFLIVILCLILTQCKKSDYPTSNPTIPPITKTDSTVNKNVHVVDSTKLILISDTTLLNKGHLEYTVVGAAPTLNVNDIIVGSTNGGYIRKVTSIDQQQNKIIIESTQGTMEDVFNNASFNFTTGMEGLKEGRKLAEYSFDVSGSRLYQNGSITIKLDKGIINVGGDWNFDFDFKDSKLENFMLECKNASFNGEFDFTVTADNTINIVDTTVTLKRVAKYYTKFITVGIIPVPVVVYMEVELRGKLSASIESKVDETFSVNSNTTMDLGLSYTNSQWQPIYSKTSSSSVSVNKFNDNLKAKLELGLIPYVSFRLYRVAGPYASFGLRELVRGAITLPAGDWNFYAGAWLQTIVGARAGIFSKSFVDYNKEWNTDTIYYQTPDKIEKSSGDNQTGTANEFLGQHLKVRVLDFKGNGQSKVPVYFSVTAGGGTVENASILTDKDGYAQTSWKLGSQNVIQTVEATVKRADGSLINGAPIEFAASANAPAIAILTTAAVTYVTSSTAISGGNISSEGGATITERGVCWSTSHSPTVALPTKTNDGTGTGSFVSNITGLTADTTYYVRAYATNSAGTAYGNEVSFTTAKNNDLNGTTWYGYYRCASWDPDWGYDPIPFPIVVPKGYAPVTIQFSTTTDARVDAVLMYVWNGTASSSLSGSLNRDHTQINWTSASSPNGDAVPVNWQINGNQMTGKFTPSGGGCVTSFTFFKL